LDFLNYFKTFPEECGTNEKYTKYAAGCKRGPNGSPDKTCDLLAKKNCETNVKYYAGCFCDFDSVRDSNGKCINYFDCPNPICGGEDEVFNKCGYELTCSNATMMNDTSSKECVPGCYCKPGTFRDIDDECIQLEKCPKPCSDETNEEFLACGSGCGDYTCNNHTNKDRKCPPCKEACFCKKDFVRNSRGRCIKLENCLDECEENEYLCSFEPSRVATCDNQSVDRMSSKTNILGCYCKDGFVRQNPEGTCIAVKDCPKHSGI